MPGSCKSQVPMNLITSKVKKTCNNKCNLSYQNMENSACSVVADSKDNIAFVNPEGTITFNNENYKMLTAQLWMGSINKYNNQYIDAEVKMYFQNSMTKKELTIYIPVIKSNDTSNSKKFFNIFMNHVKKNVVNVNTNNFNFKDVIPSGSFYYIDKQMTCDSGGDNEVLNRVNDYNKNANTLIFSPEHPANMSDSDFKIFKKLYPKIESWRKNERKRITNEEPDYDNIFKNTNTSRGDDIVIDCQPVDINVNGDAVPVEEIKTGNNPGKQLEDLFNNVVFQIVLGIIGSIIIYKFIGPHIITAIQWIKDKISKKMQERKQKKFQANPKPPSKGYSQLK
jgi:hypothetical protein